MLAIKSFTNVEANSWLFGPLSLFFHKIKKYNLFYCKVLKLIMEK